MKGTMFTRLGPKGAFLRAKDDEDEARRRLDVDGMAGPCKDHMTFVSSLQSWLEIYVQ